MRWVTDVVETYVALYSCIVEAAETRGQGSCQSNPERAERVFTFTDEFIPKPRPTHLTFWSNVRCVGLGLVHCYTSFRIWKHVKFWRDLYVDGYPSTYLLNLLLFWLTDQVLFRRLVVIAGDISPIDVITHVPILCEDANIPYIYVPSKEVGVCFLLSSFISQVIIRFSWNFYSCWLLRPHK